MEASTNGASAPNIGHNISTVVNAASNLMYGDRQTDKLLIIYCSGSRNSPNYATSHAR